MASRFRSALAAEAVRAAAEPAGYPFAGPGTWSRTLPFAAIAVVAELSLALPPGPRSAWAAAVSAGLLVASAGAFLLPWRRLPELLSPLVPLLYTGSVLALILAAGATSGAGIVIMVPLIWTVLFQRWRDSFLVLLAIVIVEIVISLTPVPVPDAVIARRVVLWMTLGAVIAVATHGLRDRIARAQEETDRLQDHLRQLTVLEDRERIAADIRQRVIQRLFAAGLALQGAVEMIPSPQSRRRVESAMTELDHAISAIRDSIFAVERRPADRGVRAEIIGLVSHSAHPPEVRFSGPIDESLASEALTGLLETLKDAVTVIRPHFAITCVEVAARTDSFVAVIDATPVDGAGSGWGSVEADNLRRGAARAAGIGLDIQMTAAAARFAWVIPLSDGPRDTGAVGPGCR
jgi:signal transduction histidine kinase